MGTIKIPLHSRKYPNLYALIDEEDYELVRQYRWNPDTRSRTVYAQTQIGQKTVYLHRLLVGPDSSGHVDHANQDGLDNRRSNLRVCTQSENNRNSRIPVSKTGYRGVERTVSGKYRAYIYENNRRVLIGLFDLPEIAAIARDEMARKIHGDFAVLNFPKPGERGIDVHTR